MYKTQEKYQKNRNIIWATCALTIGAPILAVAILPSIYAVVVPIALAIPFFTLTCLDMTVNGSAQA